MSINGKPGTIEKVDDDDRPVRLPGAVLPASWTCWPARRRSRRPRRTQGERPWASFAPAHYLKQFHPKYVGQAQARRDGRRTAGFDNWVNLFKFKNDWALNPDLPVVTPWKTATPINTPIWTLERNPYCIWVDTEGNQLPYIDKIQLTLAENLEVLNLRAIAGEYDLQERHIDIGKLPVFLENQQKGNYKLHLDPGDYGADCVHPVQPELRGRPRDREVAQQRRLPPRALARHRPRPAQRDVLARDWARPARWCRSRRTSTTPARSGGRCGPRSTSKQANELLDKIGLTRRTPKGSGCGPTERPAPAHRAADARAASSSSSPRSAR